MSAALAAFAVITIATAAAPSALTFIAASRTLAQNPFRSITASATGPTIGYFKT
jgi:hypothetical protein